MKVEVTIRITAFRPPDNKKIELPLQLQGDQVVLTIPSRKPIEVAFDRHELAATLAALTVCEPAVSAFDALQQAAPQAPGKPKRPRATKPSDSADPAPGHSGTENLTNKMISMPPPPGGRSKRPRPSDSDMTSKTPPDASDPQEQP